MRDSRRVDHQALTQGAFSGAAAFAKAAPLVVLDTVILAALVDLRPASVAADGRHLALSGRVRWRRVLGVFVFAPMIIAAHRYSVAGMLTPRLTGSLAGPIFGRFVKTSLILSLITVAGYAGGAFLSEALDPPLGTAVFFMAFAATIALSVRLGPLFPAISVNANGAGWGAAWRDTAGYGWRIFFVLAICSPCPSSFSACRSKPPCARWRFLRVRRADPDPLARRDRNRLAAGARLRGGTDLQGTRARKLLLAPALRGAHREAIMAEASEKTVMQDFPAKPDLAESISRLASRAWRLSAARRRRRCRPMRADLRQFTQFLVEHLGEPADRASLWPPSPPMDVRAFLAARRRSRDREPLADAPARGVARLRPPSRAGGLWRRRRVLRRAGTAHRQDAPPAPSVRKTPAPPASTATRAGSPREPWILARDAAVLGLLYGAGLRISEALGIRAGDAPVGDRDSILVTGKGGQAARRARVIVPVARGDRGLSGAMPLCPER